jgi:hypothetical protein
VTARVFFSLTALFTVSAGAGFLIGAGVTHLALRLTYRKDRQ